jgi:hypothetical protein
MTDPLRPLRDRLLIIEEQAQLLRELLEDPRSRYWLDHNHDQDENPVRHARALIQADTMARDLEQLAVEYAETLGVDLGDFQREQAVEMAVNEGRAAPIPWRGGDC